MRIWFLVPKFEQSLAKKLNFFFRIFELESLLNDMQSKIKNILIFARTEKTKLVKFGKKNFKIFFGFYVKLRGSEHLYLQIRYF